MEEGKANQVEVKTCAIIGFMKRALEVSWRKEEEEMEEMGGDGGEVVRQDVL